MKLVKATTFQTEWLHNSIMVLHCSIRLHCVQLAFGTLISIRATWYTHQYTYNRSWCFLFLYCKYLYL